jgi:drug/metabolite transporter (DMT)-like permease
MAITDKTTSSRITPPEFPNNEFVLFYHEACLVRYFGFLQILTFKGKYSSMSEEKKGHLFVLFGILCVSVIAALTKLAMQHFTALWFVAWLYIISVPLSFPVGQKIVIPNNKKDIFFFLIHFIGIATGWLCVASGLKVLDAASATFIGRIEFPILMIISMFFLKEKLGRLIWPCIFLSLTGISMLTEKGVIQDILKFESGKNLAVFMILIGAFGFATGELGTKVLAQKYNARAFTFVRNLIIAPLMFIAAMAIDGWNVPNKQALIYTALSAVAGPVLARICYMEGLKRIPLGHATVLTQLEPVLTLGFVFLLGMELPDKREYLGCSLIFLSSMILVAKHWMPKKQALVS